jgi:predicted permease
VNVVSSPQSDRDANLRIALAVFDALLFVCPREMREEYGRSMRAHFADAVCEHGAAAALRGYADVIAGGLMERAAILRRDVLFALRGMRRTPFFAATVILTIAVAVGANGGVYGMLSTILFRPLPFANAPSVAALWEVDRVHGYTGEGFAIDDFEAVRRQNHTLRAVAALRPASATLVGSGGPPKVLRGTHVTGEFFALYGAHAELGRLLDARDERAGSSAVVLSDEVWRTRLRADPSIVGRTVRLDDVPRTVVGIAPPRFYFADLYRGQVDYADYFVPIDPALYRRAGHLFFVSALAAAPRPAVDADLQRIFASLALTHPDTNANLSARSVPIADAIFGPMRPSLVAMGLAVFALLAVACANVANLFLSRGSARSGEIATRFALGASRRRLVSQLLTESSLYVLAGGLLGCAIAALLVNAVASVIDSAGPVIHLKHLSADWRTFAATGVTVVVAALLAGGAPALALSRPNVAASMRGADRSQTGSTGSRLRAALVTLEIALAIAVVAAAAISARSFYVLSSKPLGFETHNVTVASMLGASTHRYATAASVDRFLGAILGRVRSAPGIGAAAWAATTPYIGSSQAGFTVAGAHYARGSEPDADVDMISDGYFGALGIPLLAGRDFGHADGPSGVPVAIVSRSFAERYLGGVEHAIGKRITIGMASLDVPQAPRNVVGVVGDVRDHLAWAPQPTMYAPLTQIPSIGWLKLVVRSPLSPQQVAAVAGTAIAAVDPTVPAPSATSLDFEKRVDELDRRITDEMLGAFALLALALAIAGIYAVVSYGVARRTREIGVRVAFGAAPRTIVRMVVGGALRLAAAGIVVGCALAGAAAWALKTYLDVDAPLDAVTAGTVVAVIAVAVIAAAWLPARRAARVDPSAALRYE